MLNRYQGTLRYVAARWPIYLLGIGGGALLTMIFVLISAARGWWGFIPIAFAILLLLTYFLIASLWSAHQRFDHPELHVADVLFGLGRLEPEDRILHVELGDRLVSTRLMRHLTTGRLTVVDVYEPQITPGRVLPRVRAQAPQPLKDPRVIWRTGQIDLLPLPDASVFAVTIHNLLFYVAQEGDREKLLREVYRVLRPGGRLLLAERARSDTNWMVMGLRTMRLPRASYWRKLIEAAGLRIIEEDSNRGLVHYFRADKVTSGVSRQLPFEWSTTQP